MGVPVSLFPDSGDLSVWLYYMCQGCVKDRGRSKWDAGGIACDLPLQALLDPCADIPDWSPDASPVPERIVDEIGGGWPVCMAHTPRKKRSDAGKHRPPKAPATWDTMF